MGSLREAFDLDPGVAFLNHGSYGAVPRAVRQAQRRLADALEADPVAFMGAVPERLAAVRGEVASRLGTSAEALAWVENATTGVSTVLRNLRWSPGDRVVVTSHGYGAVREALRWLALREGIEIDEVEIRTPVQDAAQVVEAVACRLPGARLAIVDWITSPTGLVFPVEELVRACRREGVMVLVDGAHAPGQVPVDLDRLDADVFVGNLHKWWFAPRGAAVLWSAARWRDRWAPLSLSHPTPLGFPASFDWTGTRDPTAWLAVPSAFQFMDDLGGAPQVAACNRAASVRVAERLSSAWDTSPVGPASMRAAMVAVPVPCPASGAPALHALLRESGVQVPVIPFGPRCLVRVSSQVHVSDADVDALVSVLPAALSRLGAGVG